MSYVVKADKMYIEITVDEEKEYYLPTYGILSNYERSPIQEVHIIIKIDKHTSHVVKKFKLLNKHLDLNFEQRRRVRIIISIKCIDNAHKFPFELLDIESDIPLTKLRLKNLIIDDLQTIRKRIYSKNLDLSNCTITKANELDSLDYNAFDLQDNIFEKAFNLYYDTENIKIIVLKNNKFKEKFTIKNCSINTHISSNKGKEFPLLEDNSCVIENNTFLECMYLTDCKIGGEVRINNNKFLFDSHIEKNNTDVACMYLNTCQFEGW